MDKRTTKNSLQARQILHSIEVAEKPIFFALTLPDARGVRSRLYDLLLEKGLNTDIKLAVDGNVLFVKSKPQPSRIELLTAMVRKLMLHCDDERLYEEALALVEVS